MELSFAPHAKMELSLLNRRGRFNLSCSSSLEFLARKRNVKWHHSLGLSCSIKTSRKGLYQTCSPSMPKKNQKVLCYQKQEVPVLEGRTIVEVYDALAERLLSTALKFEDLNLKYIVGLAGPPGAGKSTLASEVIRRVNLLWSQKLVEANSTLLPDEVATVLPMDGFHLYRYQLDAMENPKEAHARRGAPWTFNPELLFKCLQTLRNEGSVYAPSFDHGVGDPVENDIFVSSQHKVVIVEGNYLLLEEDTWKDLSALFDEKWFIDVDIDVAMQRVLNRHISTGKEPDVAKWRIEYNDRPNAELIMKSKKHADLVIRLSVTNLAHVQMKFIRKAYKMEDSAISHPTFHIQRGIKVGVRAFICA
ncbi:putative uridine kinase C227.14 isoform X2 [Ananas comosus]|uniref:Uridine kinase C227.14 isoform X2 n=1 Tax=Ananas comosus TaxID=4615 RepID=A0A6P5FI01_ANACO|nr:putative uridine kinase C227.14 isoform X2 [Ananas comosus]